MVCRSARGPIGGARSPVGAGAVESDERVTAAAVGTVGAPTAVGCGTGGATNVTVLAKAGGGSENPERKEAWRHFSAVSAAAVERSWVTMAVTPAWHSRSHVWRSPGGHVRRIVWRGGVPSRVRARRCRGRSHDDRGRGWQRPRRRPERGPALLPLHEEKPFPRQIVEWV